MLLSSLINTLTIEMAVEYLCREDADLLLAEKVTEFTRKKVRDLKTSISLELVEVFQACVPERRNPELIHLLKYLKNPNIVDENQEDQFGIKIRKTKITAFCHISASKTLSLGKHRGK